ncbi:DUF4238 domain-containing protein [Dactylosporangium sp. CA-092794]|uniref:DUF4238 domain-containing protein n=1 Tax=Dactylosporangium sp. CA-092794 TaxID=3239929 RepID=UPI003D8E0F4E
MDPLDPSTLALHIEELRAEADDNVEEQHVLSKVVSKQFTNNNRLLHAVSVTDRDAKVLVKGPRGVGKVPNFVPRASRSAEALWGKTETLIPRVIKLCEQDRLHADPDALGVVRDIVALHYVRSRSLWTVHKRGYEQVRAEVRRRAPNTPGYEQGFRSQFGRSPRGDEDHDLYFDRVLVRKRDADFHSGLMFRASVERMFRRCRQWMADKPVQLLHPAEGMFLIGDSPVVSLDRFGRLGPEEGVAIGDAIRVFMPLTPRSLIAFGPSAVGVVPVEVVEELNAFQVRAASEYVFVHPASGLEDFVRTVRFGAEHLTSTDS